MRLKIQECTTTTKWKGKEIMDTSKFSLISVLGQIAEYNDVLSFKPLSYYVGDIHEVAFTDLVDGVQIRFHTWPRTVMLESTIKHSDRTYRILVRRIVSGSNRNHLHYLKIVEYEWLILKRSQNGGEFLYPYFQRAVFRADIRSVTDYHCGDNSVVTSLQNDEHFERVVNPAEDFPNQFWREIKEWVNASMEVRKKALSRLDVLHTQCVIEWSKVAAAKLVQDAAPLYEKIEEEREKHVIPQ